MFVAVCVSSAAGIVVSASLLVLVLIVSVDVSVVFMCVRGVCRGWRGCH